MMILLKTIVMMMIVNDDDDDNCDDDMMIVNDDVPGLRILTRHCLSSPESFRLKRSTEINLSIAINRLKTITMFFFPTGALFDSVRGSNVKLSGKF